MGLAEGISRGKTDVDREGETVVEEGQFVRRRSCQTPGYGHNWCRGKSKFCRLLLIVKQAFKLNSQSICFQNNYKSWMIQVD